MRNIDKNVETLSIMKFTVDTLSLLNVRRNIDMCHVAGSACLFYLVPRSPLLR